MQCSTPVIKSWLCLLIFLPKLLEVAFIVDTTYTDGKEQISQVQEIDRVDIYNAIDLEMAIAEEKLKS